MSTRKIKIEGMHCDGCAQRVLEREPGMKSPDVSYMSGEAAAHYDAQERSPDRLREVVERAGYTAVA